MAQPLCQDITEIPQKLTNGINIQYVNSASGYILKSFEKINISLCSYSQQHYSYWPRNGRNPSVHGQTIP